MGSRYYESCNSEGEIKPGKISSELREALNLAENDVPIWIYRMRALGYPPGWLRKAIVDTNDIFDTDQSNSDETPDSRKRKNPHDEQTQYDHSKLIEYPGFNTPMPKNCVDYHYFLNMPAMLEHQQLEYAKKNMRAYKQVNLPKRPRVSSPTDDSANSLEDCQNISGTSQDSLPNTTTEDHASTDDKESASEDSSSDSSKKKTINDDNLVKTMSTKSLPEEIKLVSKGSPMPKPVERTPLEKFSEGVVGELLYFDNLPNSTGRFDSIRGLLKTIRRSKSQNDTSFESV